MTSPRWQRLAAGSLAALLLAAAQPPGWFAGAGFLVLPGLAAWYAVTSASAQRSGQDYWLGCVYMACFSWSVRHVLWPAYLAIVLLGGCYFVLAGAAVRRAPAALRGLSFGVAVAASFWLRAVMPEIHYPHGQPCHSLADWPLLLGAVALGGEPLANLLLAALAGTLVEGWRRRLAIGRAGCRLRWAAAPWQFLAVLLLQLLVLLLGRPQPVPADAPVLRIAAVEPGLHPMDPFAGLSATAYRQRFDQLYAERLLRPTQQLLLAEPALDLVLWPESSLPFAVPRQPAGAALRIPLGDLPPQPTRLLVGAAVQHADGAETPAALLLDTAGQLLGHHEKQQLVPGGEFLPFFRWLPAGLAAQIRAAFAAALGSAPELRPGQPLPSLQTAAGLPFAALLCYDNAFPAPARQAVAAGASFLCVLSNEAWYRGGAELAQLAAMTVVRARELGVPLVRCTTDGLTLAVAADGRVLQSLPLQPAPSPAARTLVVELPAAPPPGQPWAWLQAASGPACAILMAILLLSRWRRPAAGAVEDREPGKDSATGS